MMMKSCKYDVKWILAGVWFMNDIFMNLGGVLVVRTNNKSFCLSWKYLRTFIWIQVWINFGDVWGNHSRLLDLLFLGIKKNSEQIDPSLMFWRRVRSSTIDQYMPGEKSEGLYTRYVDTLILKCMMMNTMMMTLKNLWSYNHNLLQFTKLKLDHDDINHIMIIKHILW